MVKGRLRGCGAHAWLFLSCADDAHRQHPAGWMRVRTTWRYPKVFLALVLWLANDGSHNALEVEKGRCAMGVALEINFALWIMIGCIAIRATAVLAYLN
jgi:hypothetical protein